jgi:ATP-dependent Clp protease, protease subunit
MYKDRTVMISRFIDDNAANSIIAILLYLRKESYRDPISIYLNVPGGWLRPSLAVYDLIQNTKQNCVVETVNLGLCAGMGAVLCSAGTKGRRSCMPNARFILQRTGIDRVFRGQATDIALEVKNNKVWNDRMEQEMSLLTGQPVDRIQADLKRDFFLSSDEAVQYGLIDKVLLPSPRKRAARGQDADLGAFEGDDDTKYQTKGEGAGGWGSRTPPPPQQQPPPRRNDNNDDDGNEPKTAK